jgi:MarR family transcriptional regulator, 2-MHQ and catechol-resistance regulon repressor
MSKPAAPAPFLSVLRELVQCYQAFERYSAAHIQTFELTPAQFDVIATLGNTKGMTFRELGEKTLITKGTLTGVVDRLEAKKIVSRENCPDDGRSTIVRLSRQGEKIFDHAFPAHVSHLRGAFDRVCAKELATLEQGLGTLRIALSAATENQKETT